MSLFGDDHYQWRETYFVLFREINRPLARQVVDALNQDDGRFLLSDVRSDVDGRLESMTLKSPDDFAAMDISYVSGEEVTEQTNTLSREVAKATLTDEEREKLRRLADCDARFDVFHFEQVLSDNEDTEEFLDPAALLIVIERLSQLCRGIGIDPQSGSLM